jgi:hypothetical protein
MSPFDNVAQAAKQTDRVGWKRQHAPACDHLSTPIHLTSLDLDQDTRRVCGLRTQDVVSADINVPLPRHLRHVKVELSEYRREYQKEFRAGKVNSQARSSAAIKGNKVPLESLAFCQPPLRSEGSRLGVYFLIVMGEKRSHRHRKTRRNHVALAIQGLVRELSTDSVCDGGREAETFLHDGGQVGKLFEFRKGRRMGRIEDGSFQLVIQSLTHQWVGGDMISRSPEHIRSAIDRVSRA